MDNAPKVIRLDDLGIVRVRGADVVRFLQGQLSNDVALLSAGSALLAGYHNPQGRALALLRLVFWDVDDVLAVVPRELAATVAARLGKFVLRSKVKIIDESGAWWVSGCLDGGGAAAPALPGAVNSQVRSGDSVFVRTGPAQQLVISPLESLPPAGAGGAEELDRWRRLEVAAGQPQVYAVTSEEFVAQMLNLDVLNGIAFDKGCYTGQEVIARAHYRGRVKRRMQRFISQEAVQLAPGDSGQLADGRSFKVVLAAQLADGRCDFLAVAPLAAGAERDDSATGPASVSPGAAVSAQATAAPLAALPAPLPYALPE